MEMEVGQKWSGNRMEWRIRPERVWKVRIAITGKHVNGRRSREQMWKHVKNIGIMENRNGRKHMENVRNNGYDSACDSTSPLRSDP